MRGLNGVKSEIKSERCDECFGACYRLNRDRQKTATAVKRRRNQLSTMSTTHGQGDLRRIGSALHICASYFLKISHRIAKLRFVQA
jgi:hypothetical protein